MATTSPMAVALSARARPVMIFAESMNPRSPISYHHNGIDIFFDSVSIFNRIYDTVVGYYPNNFYGNPRFLLDSNFSFVNPQNWTISDWRIGFLSPAYYGGLAIPIGLPGLSTLFQDYFGISRNNQYDIGAIKAITCSPSISINDLFTDVALTGGSQVNVKIGLQSNDWLNAACDYFIYCDAPGSQRIYFNCGTGLWQGGGLIVSAQGNAADFSGLSVLNTTGLSAGFYTFYFTIDNNQNGNMDNLQRTASIHITVQ